MHESLEPAYRAEMLKLPSQTDVARELAQNVDPMLIHRAHRQLTRALATGIGATLGRLYDEMADKGRFSPDASSAGRRALRNAVLTVLTARREPDDLARLASHYFSATNMTDQAHALTLLCQFPTADSERAVADFYERWKNDHLVIDTWFATQAQSPHDTTVERVLELTGHPLYAMTTPNKVRALIGTFALANPVQFNRPDGAGYELVADQVLALNAINPQIAARILGSFRSWRALEPGRRRLAKKALQRIARQTSLSRDVFEIVSKMLDG